MLNHAREILCPRCCLASSFPSWPRHAARGCYPTWMHTQSAARKPLPEMANSAHFMLGNAMVSRSRYCRTESNTTQLSTRDTSGEIASSIHWSRLRTSQTTTISELQRYLFRRYTLLDRVLRARKLHHRHFFAMDNVYGHTVYLDQLQNKKYETVKALEKLGKRAAAVV